MRLFVRGFTMIELMIEVRGGSHCDTDCNRLSGYQNYSIRAKVSKLVLDSTSYEAKVAEKAVIHVPVFGGRSMLCSGAAGTAHTRMYLPSECRN
jgi:Tfp pilus assembly major pilin PilA